MTLLCQMAVMQCTIQEMAGVQPVSTSWEDFAAYHLTQVTHAPSLSQSTMYDCVFLLVVRSLTHWNQQLTQKALRHGSDSALTAEMFWGWFSGLSILKLQSKSSSNEQ